MSIEKEIREAWDAFCAKAKAGEAKGFVVKPGNTLNDAVAISMTAAAMPQPVKAPAPVAAPLKTSVSLNKPKEGNL